MEAKLDGYSVFKIRERGLEGPEGRHYVAPVYVIGLPGDVDLFNKELKNLEEPDLLDV